MKKIFSNKLLLIFSSVLFCAYAIVYACAGGDWDWYFSSNFTPETFVDKSYTPLFLSGDYFYDIGFDRDHNSRFNKDITADWSSYLADEMDKETVAFFLLKDSNKDVNELFDYYTTNTENETSLKWTNKLDLNNEKIQNFIEFLYLAKQIETASVADDVWSYEPVKTKVISNVSIMNTIEGKYDEVENEFLKNRYWFQTIKAYFYSKSNKQDAIDFFKKTKESVSKNILYYRAEAYIAGIYYKNKEYAMSNYLFSKVFNDCPEMRIVAAYSFHPQEQTDWNEALKLAKNNKEKAALWAIQGYYLDEENAISHIFELDPSSKHLNYLLTRLINNQEAKVKDFSEDKTFDENKKEQYQLVSQTALDLVDRIAKSGKTVSPYLWNLSLGYLQTLNGNYEMAKRSFVSAEKGIPSSKLAKNQLRLLRFVNNLNKITTINTETAATVTDDLQWLYQELPKSSYEGSNKFRYQNASAWSKKYLSSLYKKQGNIIMAELLQPANMYKDNYFYDDDKQLEEMKGFMQDSTHETIERIALKNYNVDLGDIYRYQSIKATYQNDVAKAIDYFKKSKETVTLLANPFNGYIQDNHDLEHAKNKTYDGFKLLTLMQEMKLKLEKNEDVYNNSLLLGNAFYNITHFGNARYFYEDGIVGYASSPYYFRNEIKKMITNCSLAKKYYQKAFETASTKEEKAKSLYMLAKCERNEYYKFKYYDKYDSYWSIEDDGVDFIAWKGFQLLKKEYANTQYYKEVINECGYFKAYVAKQ